MNNQRKDSRRSAPTHAGPVLLQQSPGSGTRRGQGGGEGTGGEGTGGEGRGVAPLVAAFLSGASCAPLLSPCPRRPPPPDAPRPSLGAVPSGIWVFAARLSARPSARAALAGPASAFVLAPRSRNPALRHLGRCSMALPCPVAAVRVMLALHRTLANAQPPAYNRHFIVVSTAPCKFLKASRYAVLVSRAVCQHGWRQVSKQRRP